MEQAEAWDLQVLGPDAAPSSKQILGVELGLEHLTLAVAWEAQRRHAEVWELRASKVQAPWFPLVIGHTLAQDGAIIRRHQGTTMLAKVLAASQKRR